jgi:outer membrane protein, multidrug efflux system
MMNPNTRATSAAFSVSAVSALAALVLALGLSACASRSTSPVPTHGLSLPPSFMTPGSPTDGALAPDWWRGFGSDELSALVDRALADNPDLNIATERVRQAQALATIAGASLFPALNLVANASQREVRGTADPAISSNANTSSSALGVSLSASYELDLWAKNTSLARSAEFALHATRFDRDTVRLTLVGGVATAYFQLLSLRGRLTLARDNLAIAERVFKVVTARADNGAASPLDRARQQAILLGQQAALPPLELQERQVLYALAVLVGQAPQGFASSGSTVLNLRVPNVAAGLPASLLLRRPDLASAEAQLAAAHANVAAARAALLPAISLTGSLGAASASLSGLVSSPTLALSVGAGLLQPLFDAGRLQAQVELAQSREQALVLGYRKAIWAALVDVENALAARQRWGETEGLLAQSLAQSERAFKLAEVRYRAGADDLIVLLDAQRTLFQSQDQLAQIRLSRLQAAIDLFKALVGGWQQP